MIVRLWHGRVPSAKAGAYRVFLTRSAIPDYRSVPGNISVYILERRDGGIAHFITLTFWEGMAAIRGFAVRGSRGREILPGGRRLPSRIRASRGALRGCRAVI